MNQGDAMIHRPAAANAFEFVIVSSLRAAQLMRGCTPRVPASLKAIVTAQREVAEGKVSRSIDEKPS
jgi:DNA-directed RNA polymerase subunit K/omega